jgi:hypothetical protein
MPLYMYQVAYTPESWAAPAQESAEPYWMDKSLFTWCTVGRAPCR